MTEAERELLVLTAETLKHWVSREDNRNGRPFYLALEKLKAERGEAAKEVKDHA